MDYDELIARCGGNKASITREIEAFHDMNTYYRDVNSDDVFRADRFSGFRELQKSNVKDSIFTAGFDLQDFGRWIRDGQIYRLADVRKLPRVLADDEATATFVNGGVRSIEDAMAVVETKHQNDRTGLSANTTVDNASMAVLAEALLNKIKTLPRADYIALRDRQYDSADQDLDILTDLAEQIRDLLQDVSK